MVIDDFKRPSLRRRRNGAEVVGMIIAPVRRGRSNRAAAQSRLAEHGARRCEQQAECDGAPGRPGPAAAGRAGRAPLPYQRKCAEESLGTQVSLIKGGGVGGSHRNAKCNARGEKRVTARNYISRQDILGPGRLRGAVVETATAAGRRSAAGSVNPGRSVGSLQPSVSVHYVCKFRLRLWAFTTADDHILVAGLMVCLRLCSLLVED